MSFSTSSRLSVVSDGGNSSSNRADELLDDSPDAKVIIPLSLLKRLQLALGEEQAESARKEERISIFHASLRGHSLRRDDGDHVDETRSLYRLLELTRLSVDFYYQRSKELEQILIPLLNPNNRRWHFPYANTEYVAECVEGLTYVKLDLSSGDIVNMVLLENANTSRP